MLPSAGTYRPQDAISNRSLEHYIEAECERTSSVGRSAVTGRRLHRDTLACLTDRMEIPSSRVRGREATCGAQNYRSLYVRVARVPPTGLSVWWICGPKSPGLISTLHI